MTMTVSDEAPVSAWAREYARNLERITSHPLFPALVREVAVAEQPSSPPWRFRYSDTYCEWYVRGMTIPRQGGTRRRADWFVAKIADSLGCPVGWEPREWEASVYVAARDAVRCRRVR